MSAPLEEEFDPEYDAENWRQITELVWDFIGRVYRIVIFQLLRTVAVYLVLINVHPPIKDLCIISSLAGLAVYTSILVSSSIVMILVRIFHHRHPINFLLLVLFTLLLSLSVGFSSPFASGRVILESVIRITVLAVILTLCTFWGTRKGHDFCFLMPFLVSTHIVLLVYGVSQIYLLVGEIAVTISEVVGTTLLCGYIVCMTDNLIKRFPIMNTNTFVLQFMYFMTSSSFSLITTLLRGKDD
ncbi:protein LIFEGUARD 2-like isoform X1 [Tasmannia lanceolata]|uniref:protein LIFEGUARD 2-like isoform X1 n=1 Tax=Tasmannia lanceolata TaxID=3420 RepID=UPI0040632272